MPRSVWPDCPNDIITGMANVTLVDSSGNLIGHDEGPQGASTGLSNQTLGNTFSCAMRLPVPDVRDAVYATAPWVSFAPDERIQTLMVRRLANAMERVAVAAGISQLGAKLFYTAISASSGTLTPSSLRAVQSTLFAAISSEFATEIDNATDADLNTGLVQVNPTVAIATGKLLTIAATVAPNVGGYVLNLDITLSVQQ